MKGTNRGSYEPETALSVVIPLHGDRGAPYLATRLDDLCGRAPRDQAIEFIVSDYGSSPGYQRRFKAICRRHRVRYIYRHAPDNLLSLSTARNVGVAHARGKMVAFLDVDFRVDDDFWRRLLKVLAAMRFTKFKKTILSVPAFFLGRQSSKKFAAADIRNRFLEFYLSWLQGGNEYRYIYVPFSSMVVTNRLNYLALGGQHPTFRGYGGEDFEFLHRMLEEERAIPPPRFRIPRPGIIASSDPVYRGFLPYFSMAARPAMLCGLFAIHIHHPKNARFYKGGKARRPPPEFHAELATQFSHDLEHPHPIVGAEVKDRVLFVGNDKINPESCLRDLFPLLGEMTKAGEPSPQQMAELIKKHRISLVLFHRGERYKELVEWCRKNKMKTLFVGKGIMPDSWFFSPYDSARRAFEAYRKNNPKNAPKKQTARYLSENKAIAKKAAKLMKGNKNRESLGQFVYFLRNEFYSFAKVRRPGAKSPLSAPIPPLDFYEIRLAGKPHYIFEGISRPPVPISAPLFERFRADMMPLPKWIKLKLRIAFDMLPLPRRLKRSITVSLIKIRRKLGFGTQPEVADKNSKVVGRIYPIGRQTRTEG